MLGPLVAMALCNFSGARLRAAPGGRPCGQLIIGTALGLYFTPLVAREVASYWPLLVFAALFAILVAWGCGWFLSRTTDTDRSTAFFASVPGGAAEMAILGERYGARVDRIALAQSMRIIVVVIVVPFALTYSVVHGRTYTAPRLYRSTGRSSRCCWHRCDRRRRAPAARMPNAFMFGPLLATIALTASEAQFSSVPTWMSNLAQVLLGCALGLAIRAAFSRQPRPLCGGGAGEHPRPSIVWLRLSALPWRAWSGAAAASPGTCLGARRHRRNVHYRQGAAAGRAAGDRRARHAGARTDQRHRAALPARPAHAQTVTIILELKGNICLRRCPMGAR
jgi:membrane AbrB-like protein